MSTNEIDRTLKELGAEILLEEPQAEADARRRRVVSQMQRVNVGLVRESQKVRWLRWGVGGGLALGAAAAVALSILGPLASQVDSTGASVATSPTAGSSLTARPFASNVPLRTEMTKGRVTRVAQKAKRQLALGDSLVLEEAHMLETEKDSHARVHGGRGLDIDVGPGSRVVVGAVDPKSGAAKIQLQRGLVNCSVDPAGQGPKLSVVTPDATVEVKGTIFSVEVTEEGASSRTCVQVTRGLVSVTRQGKMEQVRAGQASGCDAPEITPEEETVAIKTSAAGTEKQIQPNSPPLPREPTTRSSASEPALSSLALQNSLLARALAAEREGRLGAAESQLSELLERFPNTPLRADAEAARSRIRKRSTEQRP